MRVEARGQDTLKQLIDGLGSRGRKASLLGYAEDLLEDVQLSCCCENDAVVASLVVLEIGQELVQILLELRDRVHAEQVVQASVEEQDVSGTLRRSLGRVGEELLGGLDELAQFPGRLETFKAVIRGPGYGRRRREHAGRTATLLGP